MRTGTRWYRGRVALTVLAYLGLVVLVVLASVLGPLAAGRALANRELEPDAETLAIEAEALALLAGHGLPSPE